jgi:acyl-homoserine-lactone acylase
MKFVSLCCLVLVVAFSQFSLAPFTRGAEPPASSPNAVTIERDEWGVAHVHGKSHSDASFGIAGVSRGSRGGQT